MAGRIIIGIANPALDANGAVDSGATLTFYQTGTTTLQSIYSADDLATPLANPLSCDAAGRFPQVWAPVNNVYTVKWTPTGATAITYDNIRPIGVGDNWVAAEQFGAKGDGTTDDTSAINAAITYLIGSDVNGGTLVLSSPHGYATTGTIGATDNPVTGLHILGYGSKIIYSGSGIAIDNKATGVSGNNQSPVFSIRGLGVFLTDTGAASSIGIRSQNASVWYENVFVEGATLASFNFYNSLFWSENCGMLKCGSSVGDTTTAYDVLFTRETASGANSFARFNCTEFLTQGAKAVFKVQDKDGTHGCSVYQGVIGPINGNISNSMDAYFDLDAASDMTDTIVGPINCEINGSGAVGAYIVLRNGESQVGPALRGYGATSSTAGTKIWSDGTSAITPTNVPRVNALMSMRFLGRLFTGDDFAPGGFGTIGAKTNANGTQPFTAWNADTTGNNFFAEFGTEGTYTARGSITYNRGSSVVAYNTTSDYRSKVLEPGAASDHMNVGGLIDAVQVHYGRMNDATESRAMFIAHEVADAGLGYMVCGEKDAVTEDGKPVFQQLANCDPFVPLLWAALQEERKRTSKLERVVADILSKIGSA